MKCGFVAVDAIDSVTSSCNVIAEQDNTVIYQFEKSASLILTEENFNKNKHNVTYCGKAVCLIDKKPFWGSDGNVPETILTKIVFKINELSVELDTSGMFDPLLKQKQKSLFKVIHYYDDTWKVKGRFSDGAGAYFAGREQILGGAAGLYFGGREQLLGGGGLAHILGVGLSHPIKQMGPAGFCEITWRPSS